ncbi:ABC transporter permease, partial [Halorubrum sp. Atlit-26R]
MVSKRFVLKRLLMLFPVLFGVATVVFAILHLSPGDPAVVIAGERASQEFVNQVRADLGLDDPLWQQYVRFLGEVATFDFGQSYQVNRGVAVSQILADRLP